MGTRDVAALDHPIRPQHRVVGPRRDPQRVAELGEVAEGPGDVAGAGLEPRGVVGGEREEGGPVGVGELVGDQVVGEGVAEAAGVEDAGLVGAADPAAGGVGGVGGVVVVGMVGGGGEDKGRGGGGERGGGGGGTWVEEGETLGDVLGGGWEVEETETATVHEWGWGC